MPDRGRILLADDEEMFLDTTADLLRREGYECACAQDAAAAARMLQEGGYDLLIADIQMPGNPGLELIRDLPGIADGLRAIIVTGYPSLRSALDSFDLPVAAYLVKPVDFEQLKTHVQDSIRDFRAYRSLRAPGLQPAQWDEALAIVGKGAPGAARRVFTGRADAFIQLTFANIVSALGDLKRLTEALLGDDHDVYACNLLQCPRLAALRAGLEETVRVLEKTKHAFKSKPLGELRKGLEELLRQDLGDNRPASQ